MQEGAHQEWQHPPLFEQSGEAQPTTDSHTESILGETSMEETPSAMYKRLVGVSAEGRGLTEQQILTGIADPAKERERLREEDLADDRREIGKLYNRNVD